MREWLSWWSTTLPRSGSRVRVPSRAFFNKKEISNRISFFIKSNPGRARSSSVSEDIKPSSVRAKRWSTGPTAPSRALKKTFNRMSFFTLQKSNLLAFFSLLCYINYRHMSITKVRCFHGQTYKMPANLHRTGL